MTVLQGPADADHFRVKVGKYKERWYCDPLPACDIADATEDTWPSISGVKSAVPFPAADYVAMQRCSTAIATATAEGRTTFYGGPDDVYEQLKLANRHGQRIAFNRGTIIHYWFEDMLNGKPMRTFTDWDLEADRLHPDALTEATRYIDAIHAWFKTYTPELVAAEFVCIHRDLNGHGYGGTGDAIIRIDDKLYLVDWKSRGSDHDCYPEEAAQVAALAGAQYMIITGPEGSPVRALIPPLDGGLIVSIKTDGCRTYPVML